jgi:poly(glycerol-phosphate) alpha-glucosyltransferase
MNLAQLAFSLSNRGGGIFEILLGQSHALRNLGVGVQVLGLEDDLWSKDRERWGAVPASVFSVQGPRFFGYSGGFSSALEKANPDLCHLHSLWMYPGVAMQRWSRKNGRPYMLTPNGMLEPWALRNSGWKKRLAGLFYEKSILRGAACLQANTLKEADDFRAYGLMNRIEIVPNGVDLPGGSFLGADFSIQSSDGRKRLLFLGRIHPKKGLLGALRAWAELRNSPSEIRDSAEWQFVIAGWDQGGHEAELKRLCGELGLKVFSFQGSVFRAHVDRNLKLNSYKLKTPPPEAKVADVVFCGPAFEEEKNALLRSADAFILPSFSEGLPMSVLEAWAYGLPVAMTPECNLPEGFACGAALEIRSGEGSFQDGMRILIEMTNQERAAMGMRGRRLVEERFTWPKVAKSLKEIYESLL